jgi:predicted nucleotidyltransferase
MGSKNVLRVCMYGSMLRREQRKAAVNAVNVCCVCMYGSVSRKEQRKAAVNALDVRGVQSWLCKHVGRATMQLEKHRSCIRQD